MKNLNINSSWHGAWVFLALALSSWSCERSPSPSTGKSDQFESTPQALSITPGVIDEASGLAMSATMAGYLWTIQDSGQPNAAYLISLDGKTIQQYNIPGTSNHDWEDMAAGPGPRENVSYLYIADIGNNNTPLTTQNIIYRVPEILEKNASFSSTELEKITFKYPDGPRDAEALLVDPLTKDIFIISKEMDKAGIYRLAFPQSTSETINAEKVGIIPSVLFATGANVSVDGTEILIRTYLSVYYWQRKKEDSIGSTLLKAATRQLMVAPEPQGEAICFDRNADGFFTLSERSTASSVSLNYYKRK